MASEARNSGAAVPKAPRTLFKKSAFARPSPTEERGDVDLFSRSKELGFAALKEREREAQRKLERAQKSKIRVEREGKRRRLNEEEDDEAVTLSSNDEEFTRNARARRDSSATIPSESASETSPRNSGKHTLKNAHRITKSSTNSKQKRQPKAAVASSDDDGGSGRQLRRQDNKSTINLDSDDGLDLKSMAAAPVVHIKDSSPDLEEVEEFPELVAAARARAKARDPAIQSRLEQRLAQLRESHSGNRTGEKDTPSKEKSDEHVRRSPKIDVGDPIIDFLVTARMEGMKPIIAKRKMSMRLKEVRMVWCDKQMINGVPLTDAEKKDFFLTFRGHRLFDSSTGRALGLKMNSAGNLVINGDGFDEGRVHLEAWTSELFMAHEKAEEERRRKAAQDPMEAEEEEEQAVSQPVPEVVKIRLTLKSKEYDEVRIMAKPDTTIQKVINHYRKNAQIPKDKTITLRFDGDELDPQSTVEGAEMEDLTSIDVYVN